MSCKENGWTVRFAIWDVDLGGPMEAQVQSYSPGDGQCTHMEGHTGTTWRIRLNHLSAAAMWFYVKLLWTLTDRQTHDRRTAKNHDFIVDLKKCYSTSNFLVCSFAEASIQGGAKILHILTIFCFQCFDAVGWVAGRASGLLKLSSEVWHGYLSGARRNWLADGPADATATPSSLAPVKSRMIYLSGAGLPRLSLKNGP